eukprot:2468657-Amphidinium_carterae.1
MHFFQSDPQTRGANFKILGCSDKKQLGGGIDTTFVTHCFGQRSRATPIAIPNLYFGMVAELMVLLSVTLHDGCIGVAGMMLQRVAFYSLSTTPRFVVDSEGSGVCSDCNQESSWLRVKPFLCGFC